MWSLIPDNILGCLVSINPFTAIVCTSFWRAREGWGIILPQRLEPTPSGMSLHRPTKVNISFIQFSCNPILTWCYCFSSLKLYVYFLVMPWLKRNTSQIAHDFYGTSVLKTHLEFKFNLPSLRMDKKKWKTC